MAAVAYNAGHEGQQKEDNWFGKLLTEPLLRAAARYCVLYKPSSSCLHHISSQHVQLSLTSSHVKSSPALRTSSNRMSNACGQQGCSKKFTTTFVACTRLLHMKSCVPVIVSSSKTGCLCCSGPSKQRVASGCTMVHAVLTAVLEWANYPPVISASVDCLKVTLHYLNTGAAPPSYACLAHTSPCGQSPQDCVQVISEPKAHFGSSLTMTCLDTCVCTCRMHCTTAAL